MERSRLAWISLRARSAGQGWLGQTESVTRRTLLLLVSGGGRPASRR
jgi:hypothetical protein